MGSSSFFRVFFIFGVIFIFGMVFIFGSPSSFGLLILTISSGEMAFYLLLDYMEFDLASGKLGLSWGCSLTEIDLNLFKPKV